MKKSLTRILAETGKVSCFAALLLCAGNVQAGEPKYKVDASQFKCITKLTPVKHFFVDNLAGNLAGTVDVAKAGKGQYPEGTVLQLIPNEVMVKQQKGFSPATNDWEFFALDTDKNGTKIVSHGAEEVNNFLGLNCSECHKAARAEFDFVCEQDHGCAPLPLTRQMFHAIQHTDAALPAGAAQRGGRRRAERTWAHHRAAQERDRREQEIILNDASNRVCDAGAQTRVESVARRWELR